MFISGHIISYLFTKNIPKIFPRFSRFQIPLVLTVKPPCDTQNIKDIDSNPFIDACFADTDTSNMINI